LAYADDLVIVAEAPEALQAGAAVVEKWMKQRGLETNKKAGKNSVMLVPPAGAAGATGTASGNLNPSHERAQPSTGSPPRWRAACGALGTAPAQHSIV
jgi:hypothetical protein